MLMSGLNFKGLVRISQWKKDIAVVRNSRQSGSPCVKDCVKMREIIMYSENSSCLVSQWEVYLQGKWLEISVQRQEGTNSLMASTRKYLGVWIFILKATWNMNFKQKSGTFRLKHQKDHSDYGMRDDWDVVDGMALRQRNLSRGYCSRYLGNTLFMSKLKQWE